MHEYYMKRCLELAQKGINHVAPNPMVGSVIVHNNKIIGEGFHQKFGESHAEVNAINSVKDKSLLSKSTLYVNLEPCAHTGKTPPCCELISSYNIPKVIIGSIDVNSKVNGKGIAHLKQHGSDVKTGILRKESDWLNRRFFTYHKKKRPYVILKWAETKDGFIDKKRKNGEKGVNWISHPNTKIISHKWRAQEASILVGRKTVEIDNPSLTTREIKGENPVRIVFDPNLSLTNKYHIFNDEAKTLIFNYNKNENQNTNEFIKIRKNSPINDILSKLYQHELSSVIIEGGASTIQHFIDEGFWDEARVIEGNIRFKDGIISPQLNCKEHSKLELNNDTIKTFYND